jgi:hypothetical protein
VDDEVGTEMHVDEERDMFSISQREIGLESIDMEVSR